VLVGVVVKTFLRWGPNLHENCEKGVKRIRCGFTIPKNLLPQRRRFPVYSAVVCP